MTPVIKRVYSNSMIKRKRKIKVLGEYVPVYNKNGQIDHLIYVLIENLE